MMKAIQEGRNLPKKLENTRSGSSKDNIQELARAVFESQCMKMRLYAEKMGCAIGKGEFDKVIKKRIGSLSFLQVIFQIEPSGE